MIALYNKYSKKAVVKGYMKSFKVIISDPKN